MMLPKRILFVCTGNLCRSTMAVGIFNHEANRLGFPQWVSEGAGTHPVTGEPPPKAAQDVCSINGFSIGHLRAQGLTAKNVEAADLICVMEPFHQDFLHLFFPKAKAKVFLMSHWLTGKGKGKAIADPYGHDSKFFEQTFIQLQSCIHGLFDHLIGSKSRADHAQ